MRQAGEPSVEEILDSIKKVIARDSRAVVAEPRREREEAAAAPAPTREEDEDVLDLSAVDEFVEAEEEETTEDAPLLGNDTVSSISESLAALAVMAEPRAAPQIVRSGETSLEALTRELLRPALTEWLDKNLPPLVERMVAAEIARIVGKKG
jgi:cell pole-organizing protein PopZ